MYYYQITSKAHLWGHNSSMMLRHFGFIKQQHPRREWQNLCATVLTQGWNRYQNNSQHRKLTGEENSLLLLPGLKPATFWSQVWRSITELSLLQQTSINTTPPPPNSTHICSVFTVNEELYKISEYTHTHSFFLCLTFSRPLATLVVSPAARKQRISCERKSHISSLDADSSDTAICAMVLAAASSRRERCKTSDALYEKTKTKTQHD